MPSNCFLCLVGNKTDLYESIEVSKRQGELFAEEHNVDGFFETSAKEGTGVKELFNHVAGQVISRKKENRSSSSLQPNDHHARVSGDKAKPKKKCNCTIF